MAYNVGILSISFHQYLLPEFCKLLGNHHLRVFTTPEGRENVEAAAPDSVDAYVERDPSEDWANFFDRVETATGELDALVVLTARGVPRVRMQFLNFTPACPTLSWMHVANEFVGGHGSPVATGFVKLISCLDTISPRRYPVKKLYQHYERFTGPYPHRNSDAIFVTYEPMQRYLVSRGWPTPVFVLKPTIFEGQTDSTTNDLRITVPGRVDQTLRDYDRFLTEVETIFASEKGDSVPQITLLGSTSTTSEPLRARCAELADSFGLRWCPETEWIPEREFERVLSATDVLCAPFQRSVPPLIEGYPEERYGKTKASGVILDAIRYGLPILVPEWFPVDSEMMDMIHTLDIGEAIGTLQENPHSVTEWKRDALANATRFDLEKQCSRFTAVLDELVDG